MDKQTHFAKWIFNGKEFCPECHVELRHDPKEEYWICNKCGYYLTDEEVEDGYGFPTLEASYDHETYRSLYDPYYAGDDEIDYSVDNSQYDDDEECGETYDEVFNELED